MSSDMQDLHAFIAVVRAGSFREAARAGHGSASRLSDGVDLLASGCDAGVRYDERLAQDMIALPIGPPTQRMVTAAAPAYLDAHGRPEHPGDLLKHACLRVQFSGGAVPPWEFERDGEVVRIDPTGPLMVRNAAAFDVGVEAAIDGLGVVQLFEDWLRPHLDRGALEPILAAWSQPFRGPYLYFHGREYLPGPLRAFVDFVRARSSASDRSKKGDNVDGL